MRLGKKNSTNLEELDYLQDLNRLQFSNVANHSMRLGKKNRANLEELDYLQDLNRLQVSNVVAQAAQKIEYYLGYYMGGGINKPAGSQYVMTHPFNKGLYNLWQQEKLKPRTKSSVAAIAVAVTW